MARFAMTIINATHLFNIVATLFQMVATLFQHCYAVLHKKLSLQIILCDITLSFTDLHGIPTRNQVIKMITLK